MPPRRDAVKEQQLVRDLWQQVEARIDSSGALRAFLTQKIDDCGQTVAFEAFDLVRQVLNPDGFVRRAHKSADQALGAAIAMPESPWTVEGSLVDRQWDFNGTWHKNRSKWPQLNDYEELKPETIEYFCKISETIDENHLSHEKPAEYFGNYALLDDKYSMPALANNQSVLRILEKLPDTSHTHTTLPIRRWETFRSNFPEEAYEAVLNDKPWKGAPTVASSVELKVGPMREWKKILLATLQSQGNNSDPIGEITAKNKKQKMEKLIDLAQELGVSIGPAAGVAAGSAPEEYDLDDICKADPANTTALEPYWRLAWRCQEWATQKKFPEYAYETKHKMCNLLERPDLILEVGYFNADSGLFSRRVIMCEIDGTNKTDPTDTDDPIKLALKLMSSFVAQNDLQAETYHIRTNYTWYFENLIDTSLLSTTGFELPEVTELIRLYGKDTQSRDYNTLHHTIHFMHHMFAAHVKIAFLIYLQVVHDIDMRSMDERDTTMRNNCFFVNFEVNHMPEQLMFQEKMPEATKQWLESKKMMHSRVQIKTYQDDNTTAWPMAPVLNASSPRSAMLSWNARVASARLPRFPYERQVCVPVVSATIQRVNMKRLVQLVQTAADTARDLYYEAQKLQLRNTTVTYNSTRHTVAVTRRQFPDRCFLTRQQQYDRREWWNRKLGFSKLRRRQANPTDENLEFTWGYEDPYVKRQFNTNITNINDADEKAWKHWDQLDVRMYYFNEAMQRDPSWKDAANGMWYVQDYIDFFDMLRTLQVPAPSDDVKLGELTLVPKEFDPLPIANKDRKKEQKSHRLKSMALSHYAFQDKHGKPLDPAEYHKFYPTEQKVNRMLPGSSRAQERAYHMFSVLSWFFDCRDSGACRWQWEDYVLRYFGAELDGDDEESEFHKFLFTKKGASEEIDTVYFDKPWFVMSVFLEINFRNALAAIHYRLWEKLAHTGTIPGESSSSLQAKAKELFNRQRSLLNTRARCVGLQGVSPGLSWKKNTDRNCLRNLLLSSLDDTLPGLDPFLVKYLEQFNAPNAALFLRTIEVSNLLALRELAAEHKLASQTNPGTSKLEQRLGWFEPAVQSEIRHLLYSVERDDSVFTVAPVVHPTKAVVLEEELMRKWVRQTLGVHRHIHTLRSPLEMKFHMFTGEETWRVFMQLFCTKTQLDNSHTQRPIVFILLQVYLLLRIMKGTVSDGDTDTAVNKVWRDNPLMSNLLDNLAERRQCHIQFTVAILLEKTPVPCTPGSSLVTWPLRDQNLWCIPERETHSPKNVKYDHAHAVKEFDVYGLTFQPNRILQKHVMHLKFPEEEAQMKRGMKDKELRNWLLLTYARPNPKTPEVKTQDSVVRQQAEFPHTSRTGRSRDTMIVAVSCFEVNTEHRLEVCLCDDPDSYIFFEQVELSHLPQTFTDDEVLPFPQYLQAIITNLSDRTLIYVPRVFARRLRRNPIHDQVYFHGDSLWRMVCVGYRAWAWKRLLVKAIFFDALSKIMTRSSLQLSLFKSPPALPAGEDFDNYIDNCQQDNKLIEEMISDTTDAFGALALKTDKLEHNSDLKRMQLIFTLFKKKIRMGRIDNHEVLCHGKKIYDSERQALWIDYWRKKNVSEPSCRFMLIDKRMSHWLTLPLKNVPPLQPDQVLQYRSYLYTEESSTDAIVKFQSDYYVRFPESYALLRDSAGDVYVGKINATYDINFFATCWDSRTYSHMQSKRTRKADSEITMRLLRDRMPIIALETKIDYKLMPWSSTPHANLDACKFICHTSKRKVIPLLEQSLIGISSAAQVNMFTLPDLYTARNSVEKIEDAHSQVSSRSDWNDETFLDSLKKSTSDSETRKLWNKLRRSSRYIAVKFIQKEVNGKSVRTVDTVLNTDAAIHDMPFDEIVKVIRARILPKPNEDV